MSHCTSVGRLMCCYGYVFWDPASMSEPRYMSFCRGAFRYDEVPDLFCEPERGRMNYRFMCMLVKR